MVVVGERRRLLPLNSDRPKTLLLCDDGISKFDHIAWATGALLLKPVEIAGDGFSRIAERINDKNVVRKKNP